MSTAPQPLRIVHLNSLLSGGGTDDQCVKLAAQLHRLGQQVVIAGPAGSPFAPRIAELGAPFFDTGPHANQLQFILRAARFIRREQAQIVHGHHGRDIWPTILAARLAGTKPKIVLTRHMAKSPSSPASRRFLLGQCDAVIAVSEFVAKVLREGVYEPQSPEPERRARPPLQGNHAKIHVIHGGIDAAQFRPADGTDKRRELGLQPGDYAFAVVGGYDLPRGKGQREFLAAASRIHKDIPQARFLVIGRGSMAELLQADIARLGLGDKAQLTGHFSDMPQVMNAIDCLVHPQIGTEALGLVVCEAHACGKPVIASALDGIPEAFDAGHYGRLVPAENVEALAAAMAAQTREPQLGPEQAEELHRRVTQAFSLEQMGAKVLRLYRDLLSCAG
ncbi:MAG: glycosyltransferase family 4 protein [Limisphaerales bacterium]